jgi:hypothetical protein
MFIFVILLAIGFCRYTCLFFLFFYILVFCENITYSTCYYHYFSYYIIIGINDISMMIIALIIII